MPRALSVARVSRSIAAAGAGVVMLLGMMLLRSGPGVGRGVSIRAGRTPDKHPSRAEFRARRRRSVLGYAGGDTAFPAGLAIGTMTGTPYQPRFMAVDDVGIPDGIEDSAVITHSHCVTYPPAPPRACWIAATFAGDSCHSFTALGENDEVTLPPRFPGANMVTWLPDAVTPVNPTCIVSSLDAL